MLLFVLRCAFWMSLVALALPWFAADKSQLPADLVSNRPLAAPTRFAQGAVARPQYFDDSTGSLPPAACSPRQPGCEKVDAKVDLIALQLESRAPAPRKAATSPAAAAQPSRRAVPVRHAVRRDDSIAALLAR